MNVGKFFVFVCGVLLLWSLGGCTTPFTVVNNMRVPLDVQCGGHEIVSDLAPGKSTTFNVADFYTGGCDTVTIVATGHKDSGEPRGVATYDIVFVSDYRGYSRDFYGYRGREKRSSRVWVVSHLDPPHDTVDNPSSRHH